jgi:hypothetical protein
MYLHYYMASGEYTLEKLKILINRQNRLGQEMRIIGVNRYWGVYTNGSANGFGYLEYPNGDKALGYWKHDMMDSEGNSEQACVFYRKEYDAHFFGLFKGDCAVEGRLFLDLLNEGEFMQFQELLKVYERTFWTKIMTPPPAPIETPQKWIVTPLEEYIVLYAWREHFSDIINPRFEWRYYWNEKKIHYCDISGPMNIDGIHNKDIADARYKDIITDQAYTITFQKLDFLSGMDAVMQETRLYADGTTKTYLLKDNEWKLMKIKALLKALPAVISPNNPG